MRRGIQNTNMNDTGDDHHMHHLYNEHGWGMTCFCNTKCVPNSNWLTVGTIWDTTRAIPRLCMRVDTDPGNNVEPLWAPSNFTPLLANTSWTNSTSSERQGWHLYPSCPKKQNLKNARIKPKTTKKEFFINKLHNNKKYPHPHGVTTEQNTQGKSWPNGTWCIPTWLTKHRWHSFLACYLLCSGLHPHPGPSQENTTATQETSVSYNINVLNVTNFLTYGAHVVNAHPADMYIFQEASIPQNKISEARRLLKELHLDAVLTKTDPHLSKPTRGHAQQYHQTKKNATSCCYDTHATITARYRTTSPHFD